MNKKNIERARLSKLKTVYKPVEIRADAPNISSDGGLLLLNKLDERNRLTEKVAACISDSRGGGVRHSVHKMLTQRVYGIALGWEDCNDFNALRGDPLYEMALGAAPAPQPTLSRFENSVDSKDLYRMSKAMVEVFIDRHKACPPKRIIIDIDATVDPAHGQQQFEFFNGFYDCHCFLPLLVFGMCDGAPMEILAAVLRPGNSHSGKRAAAILRRLAARIREAFPGTEIWVRADAGFALPEFYTTCETLGLKYFVGIAGNNVLDGTAETLMVQARQKRDETKADARFFGSFDYAAGTWERERRVIVKAEALAGKAEGKAGKDNSRFVVTNLAGDPETLYAMYCHRGESENRIKEMKLDLASGRTSCRRFVANAFRLLLHALAFSLLSFVRDHLAGTELGRSTMGQIRLKLLKIAAIVEVSTRRLLIRLPRDHPHVPLLLQILRN